MATRFLVSVGTSFIAKHNKKFPEQSVSIDEADWQNAFNVESYKSSLNDYFNKLTNNELPDASAELSSLLKKNELKPKEDDYVRLIHTATGAAEFCAGLVQQALARLCIKNVECIKVANLSEAQHEVFYDQGLPELMDLLHREITKAQTQGQDVVLAPTGGYKAIIPYFVLAGILFQVPCHYVYEDSDLVVELPALPLHADLCRWTGIEAVVETLAWKPQSEAQAFPLYQSNDKILDNLLYMDNTGHLQPSGLWATLQERVAADRRRPELQFRTQNSPLLYYLTRQSDQDNDSLKRLFLRLAEIGPYIWKGDRVPEMADHALLHHADLFPLAERLLLPIFYFYQQKYRTPFLSPEELFVLLGALHLHDCGHVVGTVDLKNGTQRRLLPTEVRDHHHVLGYLRLTEPDRHGGSGRWICDSLKNSWDQNDLSEALQAIATLGLYHRKAMKLCQTESETGKYPYPYRFISGARLETIPCLEEFLNENTLKVKGTALKKERLKLLVCLLRIIDSLDEQGSRTGGPEAVKFHLEQLNNEAQEEEERAEGLRQALAAVGHTSTSTSPCLGNQLDQMVESLFETYQKKESKQKPTTSGGGTNSGSFWDQFEQLFPPQQGSPHPLRQLGLEYAIARIKAKFKRFQEEPYREKLYIEGIDIQHKIENNNIILQINLKIDPNYDPQAKKDPQGLLTSMAKEYEIVEKIDDREVPVVEQTLENAGIIFKYGKNT